MENTWFSIFIKNYYVMLLFTRIFGKMVSLFIKTVQKWSKSLKIADMDLSRGIFTLKNRFKGLFFDYSGS